MTLAQSAAIAVAAVYEAMGTDVVLIAPDTTETVVRALYHGFPEADSFARQRAVAPGKRLRLRAGDAAGLGPGWQVRIGADTFAVRRLEPNVDPHGLEREIDLFEGV